MNTNGHYSVVRGSSCGGDITAIACEHCQFSVAPRRFYRRGDRSGLPRYNRARAQMVAHLHTEHRDRLTTIINGSQG